MEEGDVIEVATGRTRFGAQVERDRRSVAWLTVIAMIAALVPVVASAAPGAAATGAAATGDPWTEPGHDYRLGIEIMPATDGGTIYAVAAVDFTTALTEVGASGGSFDVGSITVHEVDAAGVVVGAGTAFQFDPGPGYDPIAGASGEMVIEVTGPTVAGQARSFFAYFDVVGSGATGSTSTDQVVVASGVDEGHSALSFTTAAATWWYHGEGGGFSSIVDSSGSDWVGWNSAAGVDGQYRGLPNLVYPAGWFHPGATGHATALGHDGPLRASVTTTSPDGQWTMAWQVYPTHAVGTVLAAAGDYWFLYEGAPGGSVEADTDFWADSAGNTGTLDAPFEGDLLAAEWVQFGEPVAGRSLFVSNDSDDDETDSFRVHQGAMTVMGFGRTSLSPLLSGTDRSFTVGLLETADTTAASRLIESIVVAPAVTVGAAETASATNDGVGPVIVTGPIAAAGLAQLTVSWETDETATTTLAYGTTPSLEMGSVTEPGLRSTHLVTATGLACDTDYYWQVITIDGGGNSTSTPVTTSPTLPCGRTDTPPPMPGAGPRAPVGIPDSYNAVEDTLLTVSVGAGVSSNDHDADGDALTVSLASDVGHGSLSLAGNGSFSYDPDPDFFGTDTFSYRVADAGATSAPIAVTITVAPRNDAPDASPDGYVAPVGVLAVGAGAGVLNNDTDIDGDTLHAELVDGASNGLVTLHADGSFSYLADIGFDGIDSFTYRASDGALRSPTVTVTIEVFEPRTGGGTTGAPHFASGAASFDRVVLATGVDEAHAAHGADFDGDGDIDVIATDYIDGHVVLIENDGGTFTKSVIDANLVGAYPAAIADLDDDGDIDVLAAGYDADTFAWYQNDGSANFTKRVIDSAADGAHSILAHDVDSDGDLDLVTSNQDGDSVDWYRNNGSESFTHFVIDANADGAKRADAADLDGDGDIDVIATAYFGDEVTWYENDGSESFTEHTIVTNVNGGYFVAPGDFDGDGDVDIIGAGRLADSIDWYRNNGSGGFAKIRIDGAVDGARSVEPADLDGDGDLDAIGTGPESGAISWYENDGSGNFTTGAVDLTVVGPYGLSTVDFDLDGDLDVISTGRDDGTVSVHLQERAHFLAVENGATVTISDATLDVVDADTGAASLIYMLTTAPSRGVVRRSGVALGVGDTFSQADIDQGRMAFVDGGGAGSTDSFMFSVTDGSTTIMSRLDIVVNDPGDLLVHLRLDEGSGTSATDASGAGNNGSIAGGATYTTNTGDGSSHALLLDGSDDTIALPAVDVDGTGLAMAVWFRASSFAVSDARLISKASGDGTDDHVFMLSTVPSGADRLLRARIRVGGSTSTLVASGGGLAAHQWYHAAVSYDGAVATLYLDGAVVATTTIGGPVDTAPSVPVAVGSQPPGAGGRHFDGAIDDVRIYQRALSQAEIIALASGG